MGLKDQSFKEVQKCQEGYGNIREKQIDILLDILVMTETPVSKA